MPPNDPDPIAQLERSHRRLEEACAALAVAARDHDIETASNICGFFARQVERHEQDEESSLFPRLTGLGPPPEIAAVLAHLTAEHREHEVLHARLEQLVSGRDDEVPGDGDLWSKLAAAAEQLTVAYRAHLQEEENVLFPAARRLLPASALDEISTEMDERRGRGPRSVAGE